MKNENTYDYDDVNVVIDSKYASFDQDVQDPDLSFALGHLKGSIPIILYYESSDGDRNMEKACADNGILTAGGYLSNIPLPTESGSEAVGGFRLFEAFSPVNLGNRKAMEQMRQDGNKLLVGVSASPEHARAVANELRLADAVLIGPTQGQTTRRLESVGITVPRVTMIEDLSWTLDVPVVATASSPSDVCKALVAGADAALIHFGGPYEPNDDLGFAVKSVVDSLRETLSDLCLACGAKDVKQLAMRCRLSPK